MAAGAAVLAAVARQLQCLAWKMKNNIISIFYLYVMNTKIDKWCWAVKIFRTLCLSMSIQLYGRILGHHHGLVMCCACV